MNCKDVLISTRVCRLAFPKFGNPCCVAKSPSFPPPACLLAEFDGYPENPNHDHKN